MHAQVQERPRHSGSGRSWSAAPRLALAAALLLSGGASAVGKGGTLYIRARDTRLLAEPQLSAKVLATLQPGHEVKWLGTAPGGKQLHGVEVTVAGKAVTGYTLQQNLTPNKPAAEYLARDDGKPMSAQAFASSGAATKALSEAGLKYSNEKRDMLELTKGVMTAEGIAASVDRHEAARQHQARTGGAK